MVGWYDPPMIAVEDLAKLPFFQGFTGQELAKLLTVGRHRIFQSGQVVFGEALPDDCSLFVAVKGGIRVAIAGKDHQQFVIGNAGEGTIFGEMSFVDGNPRSATITATQPLETLSLSRQAFEGLAASDSAVALKVVRRLAHVISMRLRNADKFVVDAKSAAAGGPAPAAAPPPLPAPPPMRVSTNALGRIEQSQQPDLFRPVEKLPKIETKIAGGLQSGDIKESPNVFQMGDPTKKDNS